MNYGPYCREHVETYRRITVLPYQFIDVYTVLW